VFNSTLPLNAVILKFTLRDHLQSLGKHPLNFHQLNRLGVLRRLNDIADQEVLLFGHGLDRRPFGQEQFFWGSTGSWL
jgi:hypothetical protein